MTAARRVVLTCDGTNRFERSCSRSLTALDGATVADTRRAAAGRGWRRERGRDYCEDCDTPTEKTRRDEGDE